MGTVLCSTASTPPARWPFAPSIRETPFTYRSHEAAGSTGSCPTVNSMPWSTFIDQIRARADPEGRKAIHVSRWMPMVIT